MNGTGTIVMSPSTDHPHALPDVPALRRLTKSLAMLDAILSPVWESRYYSFNSHWGVGEEMASMRNGSGDGWFLHLSAQGAVLEGFAHEASLANDRTFPGGIQRALPACFASFLGEAAFNLDQATFCLWREPTAPAWSAVLPVGHPLPAKMDGSVDLLAILDAQARTYQAWAQDYYELQVGLTAVEAIYAHAPISVDLLAALNPELRLADIAADAAEIGYPALPSNGR